MRNVEFHVVPAGHMQVPPVQVPAEQVPPIHHKPAPAALKHVVVFTGLVSQFVQEEPTIPRSKHTKPF